VGGRADYPSVTAASPDQAYPDEAHPDEAHPDEVNPEQRRAFVALGSNLGDRWVNLRAGLAQLPGVVAVSGVYETAPVGGPPGQGLFLNMVAELQTSAAPFELLAAAHRAEALAGRARTVRWGPRTLDVDILLVGDLVVDVPDLQVPHPRMWERGFVLVPLADLAPEIVAGRLDDGMRSGVVLAGTLGPGQGYPIQPGEGLAGQDEVRQGHGRQQQRCQER
jgi:2-amino-4-hydroxy-6-hydroxymethyldihydropteridine diphosphokinase